MNTSIIALDEGGNALTTAGKPSQICGEQERRRVLGRVYAILLGLVDQAPLEAEPEAGNGDVPEVVVDREPVMPPPEGGAGWCHSN